MLVYALQSFQEIVIEGHKFWGQSFGLPAQNVDYHFFKKYKDCFAEATYRPSDLAKIFGKPCDLVIAFKYSELRHMPEETLDKIAKWIGVKPYQKRFSVRRKTRIIQSALRWESPEPFYRGNQSKYYKDLHLSVSEK